MAQGGRIPDDEEMGRVNPCHHRELVKNYEFPSVGSMPFAVVLKCLVLSAFKAGAAKNIG